jgi:ABC-type transport system involved in multi-copper enzyme maturation permease subunit
VNLRHLQTLTREAVNDAVRRRIVIVILAICLLSLATVHNCTTCDANLKVSSPVDFIGRAGIVTLCLLALWTMVLAGLLASDQLAQSMVDGRALLVLSRPVSRDAFALSRLAGSLVVAYGAGLLLLGGASFFLIAWGGFPIAPALFAILACFLSCITVAALAMSVSLYLPRVASFMVIVVVIGVVGGVNLFAVSTGHVAGFYASIHAYGPPLASSIVLALAPWAHDTPDLNAAGIVLRLFLWAAGCIGLLLVNFRHQETH